MPFCVLEACHLTGRDMVEYGSYSFRFRKSLAVWLRISYRLSPCLIVSRTKLSILLLVVMRLNVFEEGGKKRCTKSACDAAACFGQVSAGVGHMTGSRLTHQSINWLFGQSASGSQSLGLELGQGKEVCPQHVEIKVA